MIHIILKHINHLASSVPRNDSMCIWSQSHLCSEKTSSNGPRNMGAGKILLFFDSSAEQIRLKVNWFLHSGSTIMFFSLFFWEEMIYLSLSLKNTTLNPLEFPQSIPKRESGSNIYNVDRCFLAPLLTDLPHTVVCPTHKGHKDNWNIHLTEKHKVSSTSVSDCLTDLFGEQLNRREYCINDNASI